MNAPSQNLRVLGQELEKNQVSDFEVVFESDGCHVRGTLPPKPPAPPPPQPARRWSLKTLFTPSAEPPPVETAAEPQDEVFEHLYTWPELDRLDQEYRAKRHRSGGAPDDYSTSQMLRVIGTYVERQRWSLAGVVRSRQILEIRHQRPDGQLVAISQRFAELYDFSTELFKSRHGESAVG